MLFATLWRNANKSQSAIHSLSTARIEIVRVSYTLCKKCPHLELFWCTFSRIWTEYGEIIHIFPYLVRVLDTFYAVTFIMKHLELISDKLWNK